MTTYTREFTDWIHYWKHNGYWFFDSPEIIKMLARENKISLGEMHLFFYKAYEKEWGDEEKWVLYEPEKSFTTNVVLPQHTKVEGYDVVSFSCHTSAECSPLSCNHMAQEVNVNSHCLVPSFDEAKRLVEAGTFNHCEPGPYRIIEVHSVEIN